MRSTAPLLRHLKAMSLDYVDDEFISWLKELNSLSRLLISGTQITDEGLKSIGELSQLEELDI